MRVYTNKRYNSIAFYATIVIAINVILVALLLKFDVIVGMIENCISVLSPIIWGVVIAFLINPIMMRLDKLLSKFLFRKNPKPKVIRIMATIIACLFFAALVAGLLYVVIPELVNSVSELIEKFPEYSQKLQDTVDKMLGTDKSIGSEINERLTKFTSDINSMLDKLQPLLNDVLSGAWNFINVLKNFVLGYIVSIYLLVSKETLFAQAKKILVSICKKNTYTKIIRFSKRANSVFSGFLIGKIIDSAIIGILCYIGLMIMDMDYALMISVIVGVTNIIPFFGPFIGAIPSGVFILIVQPNKLIALLIFIFVLQQFDGNVLGPKILGNSTGLPGFWVMVSLFVGGGLFGFVGMVLAVPVFALCYALVRESVENRLKKKNLPFDTTYYFGDDIEKAYGKPKKAIHYTPEEFNEMDIPSIEEANEALLDK